MGRSYQTAQPQFVQDFVYTPPYEMLMKLAETKQNAYNTALSTAKLFDNLNIQHLNSEDENYNVKELQRYYGDIANNIAEAIRKDKGNTQAYMPQLESLQKELMKDYTSGNISKIQGSATALAQWEKDNEGMKKDNASRYQAAKNHYLQKWMESGGNSINRQWSGEQVTKDLDWQKITKSIGDLKASVVKGTVATPNGTGYIVEKGGKRETLSAERLQEYLMSQVLDPTSLASLRQSQQFGLARYFNEDGSIDQKGNGWLPINMAAHAGSYSQVENETKYSGDSAYSARQSLAESARQFNISRADSNNWKQVEMEMKAKELAAKGRENDGKKLESLEKIIYDPKATPAQIRDATIKRDEVLGMNSFLDFKGVQQTSIAGALNSGNKAFVKDAIQRANIPVHQKTWLLSNLDTFEKNAKGSDVASDRVLWQSAAMEYLKSPAGKAEFLRGEAARLYKNFSGVANIGGNKDAYKVGREVFNKEALENYNNLIKNKQVTSSKGIGRADRIPGSSVFNGITDRFQTEFEKKITGVGDDTSQASFLKYNSAPNRSDGTKLNSAQQEYFMKIIDSTPDSFNYFYADDKGKTKALQGKPSGLTLDLYGGTSGSLGDVVTEGYDPSSKRKIWVVPKDSKREDPAIRQYRTGAIEFSNPNTPQGMILRNQPMGMRESFFNNLSRSEGIESGQWKSQFYKDPGGSPFEIQALESSGSSSRIYRIRDPKSGQYLGDMGKPKDFNAQELNTLLLKYMR